jgi:isopenicillin N synthase-like dioxygenase
VTFLRLGTSGGIGVEPGTLVIASHGINTSLEATFESQVLGKKRSFDTTFDSKLTRELEDAAKRKGFPVVVAKTLSTNDYYEEQGRLDGALEPGYTEADKMAWLKQVYDSGVRNMEMEATALASFCNRTGIRGGLIAAALLDRLKGDVTLGQATPEQMGEYNGRTMIVVLEWLRSKLSASFGLDRVALGHGDIPVIDLDRWLSGEPDARKEAVNTMRHACENVGFFFVRQHGVLKAVSDGMFDVSRRFFDLPVEAKKKIGMAKDYPYGYENTEVLVQSEQGKHTDIQKMPDLKETFTVCLGPKEGRHPSTPSVRWPSEPADFQDKCTNYYRECERVVRELLRIAALALYLPEEFFVQRMTQHIAALRSLNYPDTRHAPPKAGQLRASAHTDYGLFTILAAGGNPDGLQLMTDSPTEDNQWMNVCIPEDCFTVNIGDMFARWTNDKWRSTRHRVVVMPGSEGNRRQSVAFFLNPTPDVMVETIESCITPANPDKYASLRSINYLMCKHFTAMGYSK